MQTLEKKFFYGKIKVEKLFGDDLLNEDKECRDTVCRNRNTDR